MLNISEHFENPSKTQEFTGVVVDNADPLKKNRIKVTIAGVLEGASANLPWVYPQLINGLKSVPNIGEKVTVRKEDSIYSMVYTGSKTPTESPEVDDLVFSRNGLTLKHEPKKKSLTIEVADGKELTLNIGDTKLKFKDGKVAFGTSSANVIEVLFDLLTALSMDMGNLGFPLQQKPKYEELKAKIEAIKGTF